MERHVKKQNGYLLVISIVLIVILAFIGTLIVNIFENQVGASTNTFKSNSAYNLAISGLEIAKRDVTINGTACANLSTSHTNESLLNGQFTTTGTLTNTSSVLSSNIGASSTSLTLASASNFAASGIVKIGSEYIYYASKSGNTLTAATRGKAGTTITSHSSGAIVSQYQCLVTVTAGVPDISSSSSGKAIVSSPIIYEPGSFSVGGYSPSLTSGGSVSISGNGAIANAGVTSGSGSFNGSTIVSYGSTSLSGNGKTLIDNGSGSLTTSSDRNGLQGDVVTNLSTTNTVYESYFGNMSESSLISAAILDGEYYPSFNASSIDGVTGKVIYVDGSASLSGNNKISIGTEADPVVLFIDGNLTLSGNSQITVYGIVYIDGTLGISGNGKLLGTGSTGISGSASLTGNADLYLTITPGETTITNVYTNLIPGASQVSYVTNNLGIQPSIP